MDVFKTIIITAATAAKARNLGACLSRAGAGMYLTGLSASGNLPATHYISSGYIGAGFAALLASPSALLTYAQQGAAAQGITLNATLSDATAIIAAADVSDDAPFDAMARLGLKKIP